MIRTGVISCIVVLFSGITPIFSHAQDIAAMLRQAESYEKTFKDEEAIKKYIEILKYDPVNITALCKTSELYSVLGKRQSEKDKQKEYYRSGEEYARRAIKVNPNNSDANFAMAISMGRMALISSGSDKVKAVKEIKTYADKCIQLDHANYKGYHILGKWHYEVSDLSSIERWLVKMTYGELPKATLADAIKNYEKSKQLNPSFLLNYLELAKAYKKEGDIRKARTLLEQLLKLPPTASDDFKIKSLGKKMLDEL